MAVACIATPDFAVALELQARPELRGRPLVLVTSGGPRPVLDCSPEAESSGVRPGMGARLALARCRDAVVLEASPARYKEAWESILDALEEVAPAVEPAALGKAYLDLTGLHRLYPSPHRLAQPLLAAVPAFLDARIGIARGKFAARVAATTTRPGLAKAVPSGEEAAFLAPLPVDHLPMSDAMRWRLRLLGLETMGDIARLPLGPFQQQFGPEGKRCWELAQGIDNEPLVPRTKEETIVRRLQLPSLAVTLEAILAGLERLVYAAYASPDRRGRWVRKAVVRASLDGGGSWELPVPFREALADLPRRLVRRQKRRRPQATRTASRRVGGGVGGPERRVR